MNEVDAANTHKQLDTKNTSSTQNNITNSKHNLKKAKNKKKRK